MASATCERASQIVLALLGGRWTWPSRTVVERYHSSPTGRIHLSGRPVTEIVSVTDLRAGDDVTAEAVLYNRTFLVLSDTCPGEARCTVGVDGCVEVEYEYGSEPPAPVLQAIEDLCAEMTLAESGEPCRLPERVTSVNRQGMSWTLIDPQDFLDKGRTGLPSVDMVIATYNSPGARARARVFSPEFRPGLRRL